MMVMFLMFVIMLCNWIFSVYLKYIYMSLDCLSSCKSYRDFTLNLERVMNEGVGEVTVTERVCVNSCVNY